MSRWRQCTVDLRANLSGHATGGCNAARADKIEQTKLVRACWLQEPAIYIYMPHPPGTVGPAKTVHHLVLAAAPWHANLCRAKARRVSICGATLAD